MARSLSRIVAAVFNRCILPHVTFLPRLQTRFLSARDITPIVATAATSRCYGSPQPLCKAVDQEAGHARRDLSPDEVAARLAWIDAHAGCIHIPAEQAMELAMEEWIAEENLAASQNGRPGNE